MPRRIKYNYHISFLSSKFLIDIIYYSSLDIPSVNLPVLADKIV